MEDKDLIRLEAKKENIKKYIDRLYATTSVNAESNTTEELVKEAKKVGVDELTKMAESQTERGVNEISKGERNLDDEFRKSAPKKSPTKKSSVKKNKNKRKKSRGKRK